MSFKKRLYKLTHWEFWHTFMFYLPNLYYALFCALKEKSLTFFTLTNPSIRNGGMGTESKYELQRLLPKEYVPKTIFHKAGTSVKQSLKLLSDKNLQFPIIVKPDVGFRGLLVKKVNSEKELIHYLEKHDIDFILQEFINYKKECGIFFIRHPKEAIGKITSITLKDYPTVKGDGRLTIKELIEKDSHLCLYSHLIEELSNVDPNWIPKKGTLVELTAIGNHSKGTRFVNGNHLINSKLTKQISKLNHQIKGWYYGRLDIKYNTWEDLENGRFAIIELNGILAEPTHIYDTQHISYWKAIATLKNHWKELYVIASYNHKQGLAYKKLSLLVDDFKELKKYGNKLKKLQ